jgi:hypothetical protein
MNDDTKLRRLWPGLPTVQAIGALGWPYTGACSALMNAHERFLATREHVLSRVAHWLLSRLGLRDA